MAVLVLLLLFLEQIQFTQVVVEAVVIRHWAMEA
jgi:hypothetical protein